MREHHNYVLKHLSKALPESAGEKFLEQKIKDSPGDSRPDHVVWHTDKKVSIIDITIPYEGDTDSFSKARSEKRNKYQPLMDWLNMRGYQDVVVDAFIVGSLGAWDTANESVLKRLSIGQKFAVLFRKLCSIDAIKGSLSIWKAKG